jgi:hypothetical protein
MLCETLAASLTHKTDAAQALPVSVAFLRYGRLMFRPQNSKR